MKRVTWWIIVLFALGAAGTTTTDAMAAVVWDESIDGDLSDNRLAPTAFVLSPGNNSVLGSVVSSELDYVTVKLLPGRELTGLVLQSYSGVDFTAFIAIQSGPTFTAAPPAPPVGSLLGYTHFGPGAQFGARVGEDLMYVLGTSSGAIGFSAPLPSGDYSFWIQQTGEMNSYQFDFVATPEPASGLLAATGLTGLIVASARWKRRLTLRRLA